WILAIVALGGLSLLGVDWHPLLLALVPFAIATLLPLVHAGLGATRAMFPPSYAGGTLARLRLLTAFLYLTQPLARLRGRLQSGLTPWRRRGTAALDLPLPRAVAHWEGRWLG